ncbi:hypothetical protein NX059_009287 [Plenodomus lindquistii]|nr:hypothetical protein NX059_009287 [Plenodomus lindquistii]
MAPHFCRPSSILDRRHLHTRLSLPRHIPLGLSLRPASRGNGTNLRTTYQVKRRCCPSSALLGEQITTLPWKVAYLPAEMELRSCSSKPARNTAAADFLRAGTDLSDQSAVDW